MTDQQHAQILEQLHRLNTGVEILVTQNDRMQDQLRELVARFEAALKIQHPRVARSTGGTP